VLSSVEVKEAALVEALIKIEYSIAFYKLEKVKIPVV
jgi:hypothetical protein